MPRECKLGDQCSVIAIFPLAPGDDDGQHHNSAIFPLAPDGDDGQHHNSAIFLLAPGDDDGQHHNRKKEVGLRNL